MAMEKTDPISTTKIIAVSLNPSQSTASGSQVMLGSDCSPSTRVPTVSSSQRTVPIAIPMTIPIPTDIP